MSVDFLTDMAHKSRARVEAAQLARPLREVRAQAQACPDPPTLRRHPQGFDIIAELKLRSPAAGVLGTADEDIAARVIRYAAAGAAAVSVLTEPSRFDGTLAHLESAARSLASRRVPTLRKDFIVDPYQVAEARAAGAGGILIILRMLARGDLERLIEESARLRLFVLLEAFDEPDIEIAHELLAKYRGGECPTLLIGINCRDLTTLEVVPDRLERLAHLLPSEVARVAESGVGCAEDAARMHRAGYDLALVGSALMRAPDPLALLRQMLVAGRAAGAE